MVSINYSSREVCCKIVYYGPGLSGKTTNLQYVHSKVPANTRGKMISLATEADRTLYFDFLPINIGTINGFAAKFQLYTVPGQVYYNATRKLVLRGVDGVVFVADSQPDKMEENIESLTNLADNLTEYGYSLDTIPVVIQYNKRDLPGVLTVDELNAQLNSYGWPHFEASATIGNGVFDTLKMIIKIVLEKAKGNASASAPKPVQVMTPDPEPEPVGVGSPSANPAASQTPSATRPEPLQENYRPYPGGESGRAPQPAPSPQPTTQQQPQAPSATTSQAPAAQHTHTPAVAKPAGEPKQESAPINRSPMMAPSVRRRSEPKKRGFFKRLFGLK
jgi:signal recognition particle receptor subunit beta